MTGREVVRHDPHTSRRPDGFQPVMSESDWKRLWDKVNKTETCWVWTGVQNGRGYGRMHLHGRPAYPHRIVASHAHGPIPPGMQVDHLCRNRACVRPDHLEIVTPLVNALRGTAPSVIAHLAGECIRGHKFAEHAYYWAPPGGRRRAICTACKRARRAEAKAADEGRRVS